MKLARRNRWYRNQTGSTDLVRSQGRYAAFLETLESRVLLTGETTVIAWGTQYLEVAKDQYIVSANAATAAALQQTLNAAGLHATNTVQLGANVFGINDSADTVAQVQAWANSHKTVVASLSPNEVYHKSATPSEVTGTAYWQYLNTTIPGADALGTTNGINAWDLATGKQSTIVAVLDTGLDTAGADFAGNIWVNPKELAGDTVDNDGDGVVDDVNGANFSGVLSGTAPTGDVTDASGHGTEVSSLIGALPNNGGSVGVNWKVQILPVVVFTGAEDTATDASIIAGLEYVMALKRSGVNITAINMSFARHYMGSVNGIGDVGNPQGATDANGNPAVDTPAINVYDAMGRATGLGMAVIIAAGNGGFNDDTNFFVPSNFKNSGAITVAASTINDTLEPTSNYGVNTVKIAAPGSAITATGLNGVTASVTGSSFAAAMVTGAVALIKSFRPNMSAQQIITLLLNTADVVPALAPYVQGGRRLNLLAALESLVGNQTAKGWVDSISGINISGWMADGNIATAASTGFLMIDGIQTAVTDQSTGTSGTTFKASFNRPDLLGPVGSTGHGFNISLGSLLTPGPHVIQVYANDVKLDATGHFILNPDGTFATTPVLIYQATVNGNVPPIGHVDIANYDLIYGWASDPNTSDAINVQINVDGAFFATAFANQNHGADVGNHAFVLARPTVKTIRLKSITSSGGAWIPSGAHRVDVYAIDDFTGAPTLLASKTIVGNRYPPLEPRAIDPTNPFFDSLDTAPSYDPATQTITGKVIDLDHPSDPVTLQVTIDGVNGGRKFYTNVANQSYAIQLQGLAPGNHHVVVYAIDSDTGKPYEFYTFIVNPNKAPVGGLLLENIDEIEGWVSDTTISANNVTVYDPSIFYRVDIDGHIGKIARADTSVGPATANPGGGPYGFIQTLPLGSLTPGQHTVTLQAFDDSTFEMFTVDTATFTVQQPNRTPTGTGTVANSTVRGTATLSNNQGGNNNNNGTNNQPITIVAFVDTTLPAGALPGDITPDFTTTTDTSNGNSYVLGLSAPTAGPHYAQIFAVDPADSTRLILLSQGEFGGDGSAGGEIDYVDFRTIEGTAATGLGEVNPEYLVHVTPANDNINADNWVQFHTTGGVFGVNTPELPAILGNVVTLYYFDQISGRRQQISWFKNIGGGLVQSTTTTTIPVTPINNFVNAQLYLTGNRVPVGNLDSASENGFSGWIIDPDAVTSSPPRITAPVQYRIDIDNIVGGVQNNASLNRGDLAQFYFRDVNHGFSIAPSSLKLLTPGSHIATLYGIDAETGVASVINQRIFTVSDSANRKPIGAVDTSFNATAIAGWAQDPSTPGATANVKVYVDNNTAFTTTIAANLARGDSHNGHGFTLAASTIVDPFDLVSGLPTPLSDGEHYFEVRAVDTTDSTRETILRSGYFEVGPPQIAGFLDTVNYTNIAGWANGPVNDASPRFRLDVNGVTYQTFTGGAQTTEGGVNIRRFAFPTPPLGSTQPTTIALYYLDPKTNQSTLLASAVLPVQQTIISSVDLLNTSTLMGWAVSPAIPSAKLYIQLVVDGQEAQITQALGDRLDLDNAVANGVPLAGHAFNMNMPTLSIGRHTIVIRALDPFFGDPIPLLSTTLDVFA